MFLLPRHLLHGAGFLALLLDHLLVALQFRQRLRDLNVAQRVYPGLHHAAAVLQASHLLPLRLVERAAARGHQLPRLHHAVDEARPSRYHAEEQERFQQDGDVRRPLALDDRPHLIPQHEEDAYGEDGACQSHGVCLQQRLLGERAEVVDQHPRPFVDKLSHLVAPSAGAHHGEVVADVRQPVDDGGQELSEDIQ